MRDHRHRIGTDRIDAAGAGDGHVVAAAAAAFAANGVAQRTARQVERATQAARSAATADALGHDAHRIGAVESDRALVVDDHLAAVTTACPRAANTRGHAAGAAAQRACDAEGAVAAAAADRLRQNAGGHHTVGGDPTADIVGHFDAAGLAASSALTADAVAEAITAGRDPGGDAEPAIAAATTDRLRQDANRVRLRRMDDASVEDLDVLAFAATGALAAHGIAGRLAAAHRQRSGEAAGAAAAANRLRQDADRAHASGRDLAEVLDRHQLARIAGRAAGAAADRGLRLLAGRQRATDGEAAVAATAADRLRQDAVGHRARSLDLAAGIVDDGHVLRAPPSAAIAAHRVVQALGRGRDRGAEREPTVAAAATDRLREDADPAVAEHADEPAVRDIDDAGVGPDSAFSADRAAGGLTARADRKIAREAAIAAATTDRLRDDADRAGSRPGGRRQNGDVASVGDFDVPAFAAAAAIAANRIGDQCIGERQSGRYREATVAAATAD